MLRVSTAAAGIRRLSAAGHTWQYTFRTMTVKRHLKRAIQLVIECDARPETIIIRLSKKQIISLLDRILPDDEPEGEKS